VGRGRSDEAERLMVTMKAELYERLLLEGDPDGRAAWPPYSPYALGYGKGVD